jgi:hypothetical protein
LLCSDQAGDDEDCHSQSACPAWVTRANIIVIFSPFSDMSTHARPLALCRMLSGLSTPRAYAFAPGTRSTACIACSMVMPDCAVALEDGAAEEDGAADDARAALVAGPSLGGASQPEIGSAQSTRAATAK